MVKFIVSIFIFGIIVSLIVLSIALSKKEQQDEIREVKAENGEIRIDIKDLKEGINKFYYNSSNVKIRFFVIDNKTVFDACLVCGSAGYTYEEGNVI